MDLGTILENLKSGDYSTPDEFAEDVRLVWKNAMTYNAPGSPVYIMATTLQNLFEKKFSQLFGLYNQKNIQRHYSNLLTTDIDNPIKFEFSNTVNKLRDSIKMVRQEIQQIRRKEQKTNTPILPRRKGPGRPQKGQENSRFLEFYYLYLTIIIDQCLLKKKKI